MWLDRAIAIMRMALLKMLQRNADEISSDVQIPASRAGSAVHAAKTPDKPDPSLGFNALTLRAVIPDPATRPPYAPKLNSVLEAIWQRGTKPPQKAMSARVKSSQIQNDYAVERRARGLAATRMTQRSLAAMESPGVIPGRRGCLLR